MALPLVQPAALRQHPRRLRLQVLPGLPQFSRPARYVRRRSYQQLHGPALQLWPLKEFI
uniref:Uncharacterized protein n=1 Tax=Arundo donax TaxID=35708 RepID=A0A0A9FZM6_ARUDO